MFNKCVRLLVLDIVGSRVLIQIWEYSEIKTEKLKLYLKFTETHISLYLFFSIYLSIYSFNYVNLKDGKYNTHTEYPFF